MNLLRCLAGSARDLWKEILTPSPPDEPPYRFAVIWIGHAMLGAAFSFLGLVFAGIYWFAKERQDLRRKGNWADGVVDTGAVLLGTLYSGPIWWPISVLFLAGIGGVLNEALRRFKGNRASKA